VAEQHTCEHWEFEKAEQWQRSQEDPERAAMLEQIFKRKP
jgi:hypothetical protein